MAHALLFLATLYAAFLAIGGSGLPPSTTLASEPPEPELNNCPDKCGDVHIPYPFGVGTGCFLADEFELTCNETTSPPSLLTGNVKVASITLETAQMVVYTDLTYSCNLPLSNNTCSLITHGESINFIPPYLVSPSDNVFTSVGCRSEAKISGQGDTAYLTGCITTCRSVNDTGKDGTPCTGHGCCEASIMPGLHNVSVNWSLDETCANPIPDSPCQYAFVSTKGWYVPTLSIY
jgi:hypothetical protein